jgi:anaerobic ribonucleoside-triphosphate reductase
MQDPVAQRVIINLPRAAYCSGKPEKLFAQLDMLVALAARAVEEKCVFVESLIDASGNAPLSTLTLPCDEKPLVKGDELVGEIAVEGLMECVQTLLNTAPWDGDEAGVFVETLLQHLQKACTTESARRGIALRLVANDDDEISQRFALLDSRLFPKTAQTVIKINPVSGALHYTPGIALASGHKLSPMECARLEGRCHAFLQDHPCTVISLPREHTSSTALADFLRKAWQHAGVKAVAFL